MDTQWLPHSLMYTKPLSHHMYVILSEPFNSPLTAPKFPNILKNFPSPVKTWMQWLLTHTLFQHNLQLNHEGSEIVLYHCHLPNCLRYVRSEFSTSWTQWLPQSVTYTLLLLALYAYYVMIGMAKLVCCTALTANCFKKVTIWHVNICMRWFSQSTTRSFPWPSTATPLGHWNCPFSDPKVLYDWMFSQLGLNMQRHSVYQAQSLSILLRTTPVGFVKITPYLVECQFSPLGVSQLYWMDFL